MSLTAALFAQSRWHKENSGTNRDLSFVTVINDSVFVVGDSGTILISTNGHDWNMQQTGTSFSLAGLTGNTEKLVTVGENGTIFTSDNRIDWVKELSGTERNLNSVTWDGEKFVAVGDSGTIIISFNGVSWINKSTDSEFMLKSVACNNTTLAAVGRKNTVWDSCAVILTSTDGVSWKSQSVEQYAPLNHILWNGLKFYAVGCNSTILNSIDGNEWNICNAGSVGSQELTSITKYFDRYLTAFGENYLFFSYFDDMLWTEYEPSSLPQTTLQSIAWLDRYILFIAVGINGMIYTAEDDDTSVLITIDKNSQNRNIDICISNKILRAFIPHNMMKGNVSIEIYSLTGKKILATSNSTADCEYTLALTNCAPGVYQLSVNNGRKRLTRQFIYSH